MYEKRSWARFYKTCQKWFLVFTFFVFLGESCKRWIPVYGPWLNIGALFCYVMSLQYYVLKRTHEPRGFTILKRGARASGKNVKRKV